MKSILRLALIATMCLSTSANNNFGAVLQVKGPEGAVTLVDRNAPTAAPRGLVVRKFEPLAKGGGGGGGGGKGGGGGGGGKGNQDNIPPAIVNMSPGLGGTVGTVEVNFFATVTDNAGIRAVQFFFQKAGYAAQGFDAYTTGSDVFTMTVTGFSPGNWIWFAAAEDRSRNTGRSDPIAFTVA
uniref:Uncharacterized protein n=1 Tax=Eutreptiella gymnastica TaxID=73025 RepID=A0A7S1I8K7_9EUGL|mmetsp:Transcript_138761/g.241289  ORF Transcript_138761/g.241289 Transcript_138761/m.241289 type:complete len:182 (+) Transcript_138761:35-580(+)